MEERRGGSGRTASKGRQCSRDRSSRRANSRDRGSSGQRKGSRDRSSSRCRRRPVSRERASSERRKGGHGRVASRERRRRNSPSRERRRRGSPSRNTPRSGKESQASRGGSGEASRGGERERERAAVVAAAQPVQLPVPHASERERERKVRAGERSPADQDRKGRGARGSERDVPQASREARERGMPADREGRGREAGTTSRGGSAGLERPPLLREAVRGRELVSADKEAPALEPASLEGPVMQPGPACGRERASRESSRGQERVSRDQTAAPRPSQPSAAPSFGSSEPDTFADLAELLGCAAAPAVSYNGDAWADLPDPLDLVDPEPRVTRPGQDAAEVELVELVDLVTPANLIAPAVIVDLAASAAAGRDPGMDMALAPAQPAITLAGEFTCEEEAPVPAHASAPAHTSAPAPAMTASAQQQAGACSGAGAGAAVDPPSQRQMEAGSGACTAEDPPARGIPASTDEGIQLRTSHKGGQQTGKAKSDRPPRRGGGGGVTDVLLRARQRGQLDALPSSPLPAGAYGPLPCAHGPSPCGAYGAPLPCAPVTAVAEIGSDAVCSQLPRMVSKRNGGLCEWREGCMRRGLLCGVVAFQNVAKIRRPSCR